MMRQSDQDLIHCVIQPHNASIKESQINLLDCLLMLLFLSISIIIGRVILCETRIKTERRNFSKLPPTKYHQNISKGRVIERIMKFFPLKFI